MTKEKSKVLTAHFDCRLPVELKADLKNKAQKYNTDATTVLKLILKAGLDQL